ncbi:MAG TPA: hypothetical protein VFQ86_13030 [Arachidicoccus soli]|nr:hypothetical protein [Arachidicoccus soli]
MKLYKLLPTCGLALGVALVLATSAFKEAPKDKSGDTLYTFEYNAPATNPYSAANVENVANWSYTSGTPSCDANNQKACSIEVHSNYVNNPGAPSSTLKSNFSISATNYDMSDAYVASTSDASGVITNQLL